MLDTTRITAYVPSYGAVEWRPEQLDAAAARWGREHVPSGLPVRLSWQSPYVLLGRDYRPCAGCDVGHDGGRRPWHACEYATWARFWWALRAGR